MTRILYRQSTATLAPYPRDDDGPVVGLDPDYLELDLIQEQQPNYDPTTHRLDTTEVIDLPEFTVTRGWQLIELPPPPPPAPDYIGFYNSLLTSSVYQSILQQSMTSDSPAISTLIAVFISAISEAMVGRANVAAMQKVIWLLLGSVSFTNADAEELNTLNQETPGINLTTFKTYAAGRKMSKSKRSKPKRKQSKRSKPKRKQSKRSKRKSLRGG
jgi:hypothetical protein